MLGTPIIVLHRMYGVACWNALSPFMKVVACMIFRNDPDQSIPAAQKGQDKEHPISTQKRGDITLQPISPLHRIRRRGPIRILGILLVIPLLVALVHVSTLLIPLNDQLLVQVDNQGAARVDLRQSIPISPYLLGANVFPEINTSSVDQQYSGFMSYSPLITSGLQSAHIKFLRFPGGTWGEDHLLSYDQLNAFSALLSQIGAEGMIQARLAGPPIGKSIPRSDLPGRPGQPGAALGRSNEENKKQTI